jgi:broad specificity phosphatase PhoE
MIFASDVLRTRQSAEMIAKKLKLKVKFNKNIREINFGKFNGKPGEKWEEFFKTIKNRKSGRPHKMENYKDVYKRSRKFIKAINKRYKNKRILIVAHGAVVFSINAALRNFNEKQEEIHKEELKFKTGELRKIKR